MGNGFQLEQVRVGAFGQSDQGGTGIVNGRARSVVEQIGKQKETSLIRNTEYNADREQIHGS